MQICLLISLFLQHEDEPIVTVCIGIGIFVQNKKFCYMLVTGCAMFGWRTTTSHKWIMQKLQWYHFISLFLADKYFNDIFGPLFAEVSRDFESSFTSSFRRNILSVPGSRLCVSRQISFFLRSAGRFCHLAWSWKWAKRFEVIFKRLLMSAFVNGVYGKACLSCWLERRLETACAIRRSCRRLVAGSDTAKQYLKISFIR